jgi:hypothetical protein
MLGDENKANPVPTHNRNTTMSQIGLNVLINEKANKPMVHILIPIVVRYRG